MQVELIICFVDGTWTTKIYEVSCSDDERGQTVSLQKRAEEKFWFEYKQLENPISIAYIGLYNIREE